jgi:hypothetical protein
MPQRTVNFAKVGTRAGPATSNRLSVDLPTETVIGQVRVGLMTKQVCGMALMS